MNALEGHAPSCPKNNGSAPRSGETETHARLKRLALIFAQQQGYSACALEVSLPRCRYRADVAAYRPNTKQIGTTAVFECKQALVDFAAIMVAPRPRSGVWKKSISAAKC